MKCQVHRVLMSLHQFFLHLLTCIFFILHFEHIPYLSFHKQNKGKKLKKQFHDNNNQPLQRTLLSLIIF